MDLIEVTDFEDELGALRLRSPRNVRVDRAELETGSAVLFPGDSIPDPE